MTTKYHYSHRLVSRLRTQCYCRAEESLTRKEYQDSSFTFSSPEESKHNDTSSLQQTQNGRHLRGVFVRNICLPKRVDAHCWPSPSLRENDHLYYLPLWTLIFMKNFKGTSWASLWLWNKTFGRHVNYPISEESLELAVLEQTQPTLSWFLATLPYTIIAKARTLQIYMMESCQQQSKL